jgi:Mg2+/citrate symporter
MKDPGAYSSAVQAVLTTPYARARGIWVGTAQTTFTVTMAGDGRTTAALGTVNAGTLLPLETVAITAATSLTGVFILR